MAKRTNWNAFSKSITKLNRDMKTAKNAGQYIGNKCAVGECLDISANKVVQISDAESSTLRRFLKSLNSAYHIINNESDRQYIQSKIKEITEELNKRNDY